MTRLPHVAIPIPATPPVHFGISTSHGLILESAFVHTAWVSPQMNTVFPKRKPRASQEYKFKGKIHGIQPNK